MSEISSGLVAVAEVGAGFSLRWTEPDYGCSCKHYDKLVRFSDAEAIISDLQNLVTAENQRKQQLEQEVAQMKSDLDEEAHIRDRMAQLLAETAVALKGPEKALHRHGWQDLPEVAAKQSAALKLASLALTEGVEYVEEPPEKNCTCHLSPPCNDCADHSAVREFFTDARKALAAIDALKGE